MNEILSFDVYGTDHNNSSDPEFLHVEGMGARAHQLKGRALPHVHKTLFQFLFSLKGDCTAEIEGVKQQLVAPCALYIPSGVVHSFAFSQDAEGWVVTGSNRSFGHDAADTAREFLELVWQSPAAVELGDDPDTVSDLAWLLARLEAEFNSDNAGRRLALENLVRLILIHFRRKLGVTETLAVEKAGARKLFLDFRKLLEQHYTEHWPVLQYASHMGVRQPILNKTCRLFTEKTAHELIQGRLLLEAQRLLIYTVATAAEIAFELGFQDPAYFNRFFRRATGLTPLQFRAQKQQQSSVAKR